MQDIKKNITKIKELNEEKKRINREKSRLTQRVKELEDSRENWKAKSKNYLNELRVHKKLLKKAERTKSVKLGKNPKGYHYSSTIIFLAIIVRTCCNCSLRGCSRLIEILNDLLDLSLPSVPSASSIYYWECKIGYNRIRKKPEKKEKWVLMIDESISIASQRILLLLGCRVSNYGFDRPLNFKDISVLWLGVDRSWTELCIGEQIRKLKEHGYEFVNGVSDGGSAIVKALKVSGLCYVSDCTHYLGNLLKNQYKKTENFKEFSSLCGQLKKEIMNGSHYYLVPPSQRTKGRFLNLFELSDWSYCMMKTLQNQKVKEVSNKAIIKLRQILKYEDLIVEIYKQCQTLKQIFKELKTKGLSEKSQKKVEEILFKSQANDYFKKGVNQYFSDNVKPGKCLVCSTDILESLFGKFKNRLSKNKMNGFGLSCLAMANMNEDITVIKTLKGMESVKMQDLEWWAKNHLPPNSLSARRKWLASVRRNFQRA
jgi:hypothetical protein